MAPRDCFGLIVRTFGLIGLATSALYFYSTVVVIFYPSSALDSGLLPYLVSAVVSLALGLYFLKGAPHIINFAYGPRDWADYGTEVIDSGSAVVNDLRICSFCGKSHAEVKKLIQGPGVWICDNCVTVCKNALEKDFSQSKPATDAGSQTQSST